MPAIAPFIYTAHAARVVFGAGSIKHLEREIDALGFKRALVLSTPEQRASAEMVANLRSGNIDGFLGPDPFNQRAVFDEIGAVIAAVGKPCLDLLVRHPGVALGFGEFFEVWF